MDQISPGGEIAQITKGSPASVSDRIRRLSRVDIDDLRTAWSGEFRRTPPSDFSRDLLARSLGWRIQEKARGGHDKAIIKLLDEYARGRANEPLFGRLKSGTVLIREYQGVRHTVTIARDGFIWREQTYANLSTIARLITGTNWNGPRFFGLRESGRKVHKSSEDRS